MPFIGNESVAPVSETYSAENAKSQMRKGFLEFPVLLIIGTKPTYAPDILKQLKRANLLVVEGTLYPLLSRLRRYGLVSYSWEESKSGPPRKMYVITKEGHLVLSTLGDSWKTLDTSVNTLIKHYEKSN
ncbi:MAG: PadR family transcriptional regulator [Candidatus Pacebacteria bacterium]|nr:PadR family transcriptional regulator [Candidatus Paceibacterota bacterium]MCF7857278.1 PadR family transcriptional regulator [Candidatus Paceibacterota bacterium]